MEFYLLQGRLGSARRQYKVCSEVLRCELGVAPETETERLYREIGQRQPEAGQAHTIKPSEEGRNLHRLGGDATESWRTSADHSPASLKYAGHSPPTRGANCSKSPAAGPGSTGPG